MLPSNGNISKNIDKESWWQEEETLESGFIKFEVFKYVVRRQGEDQVGEPNCYKPDTTNPGSDANSMPQGSRHGKTTL